MAKLSWTNFLNCSSLKRPEIELHGMLAWLTMPNIYVVMVLKYIVFTYSLIMVVANSKKISFFKNKQWLLALNKYCVLKNSRKMIFVQSESSNKNHSKISFAQILALIPHLMCNLCNSYWANLYQKCGPSVVVKARRTPIVSSFWSFTYLPQQNY